MGYTAIPGSEVRIASPHMDDGKSELAFSLDDPFEKQLQFDENGIFRLISATVRRTFDVPLIPCNNIARTYGSRPTGVESIYKGSVVLSTSSQFPFQKVR